MDEPKIKQVNASGHSSIGKTLYELIKDSNYNQKQIFAVKRNPDDSPVFSIDFLFEDGTSAGSVYCFNAVSTIADKKAVFFYDFKQNNEQKENFSKKSERGMKVVGYHPERQFSFDLIKKVDESYLSQEITPEKKLNPKREEISEHYKPETIEPKKAKKNSAVLKKLKLVNIEEVPNCSLPQVQRPLIKEPKQKSLKELVKSEKVDRSPKRTLYQQEIIQANYADQESSLYGQEIISFPIQQPRPEISNKENYLEKRLNEIEAEKREIDLRIKIKAEKIKNLKARKREIEEKIEKEGISEDKKKEIRNRIITSRARARGWLLPPQP